MKSKLVLWVTLIVTILSLTGCKTKDIEKAKDNLEFGTTIDEVLSQKGKPHIDDSKNNKLVYKDKFGEYNTLLLYSFDSNKKLKSIMVNFTDEYATDDKYTERFDILINVMESTFGEYTKIDKTNLMWNLEDEDILLSMNKDKMTNILFSKSK